MSYPRDVILQKSDDFKNGSTRTDLGLIEAMNLMQQHNQVGTVVILLTDGNSDEKDVAISAAQNFNKVKK
jgi:hypothetical protein